MRNIDGRSVGLVVAEPCLVCLVCMNKDCTVYLCVGHPAVWVTDTGVLPVDIVRVVLCSL